MTMKLQDTKILKKKKEKKERLTNINLIGKYQYSKIQWRTY